jgi:hypothetical protein
MKAGRMASVVAIAALAAGASVYAATPASATTCYPEYVVNTGYFVGGNPYGGGGAWVPVGEWVYITGTENGFGGQQDYAVASQGSRWVPASYLTYQYTICG